MRKRREDISSIKKPGQISW